MDSYRDRLKTYLLGEGADLVGFALVADFADALEGAAPTDNMKDARSVIIIAVRVDAPPGTEKEHAMAAWRGNVFPLNELAFKASKLLFKEGYSALVVPAATRSAYEALKGEISHKHAAVKSGLGCIGKSSLLVTPGFGPRVALISIITDAELGGGEEFREDLCGGCEICARICPIEDTVNEECEDGYYRIRKEKCIKCYLCYTECPIGVEKDEKLI